MKRVIEIYFSPTGTTKKVIKGISQVFTCPIDSIDITLSKNRVKQENFDHDDLVIIGLPVYAGRIPSIVTEFITNLKGSKTPLISVVVYGNRHYEDAIDEIDFILSKKGFLPLASGAFIGEHSYTDKVAKNRPDSSDLNVTKNFGLKIKSYLNSTNDFGNIKQRKIDEKNFRVRKESLPLGPTVTDACDLCGYCLKNCPNDALYLDGIVKSHEEKCIRCHNCIKNCHKGALNYEGKVDHVVTWLIDNYSERKEPEVKYRF